MNFWNSKSLTALVLLATTAMESSCTTKVRDAETTFKIESVDAALDQYFLDCGHYPGTNAGLSALISNSGEVGWKGPYLSAPGQGQANLLVDEWGTQLLYDLRGRSPVVISAGPDRRFGTKDDLSVRSKRERND
jgi:hypothetical protein